MLPPWNKQLASFESACATLPSKYAPLPASPWLNPLGSLAFVTLPFVMTVTFLTWNYMIDFGRCKFKCISNIISAVVIKILYC